MKYCIIKCQYQKKKMSIETALSILGIEYYTLPVGFVEYDIHICSHFNKKQLKKYMKKFKIKHYTIKKTKYKLDDTKIKIMKGSEVYAVVC